jgi:hypothetical protein
VIEQGFVGFASRRVGERMRDACKCNIALGSRTRASVSLRRWGLRVQVALVLVAASIDGQPAKGEWPYRRAGPWVSLSYWVPRLYLYINAGVWML